MPLFLLKISVKPIECETDLYGIKARYITYPIKKLSNLEKFDIITLPKVENQCTTTTHLEIGGYGVPGC